jgi:hypothetical protein
MRATLFAIAASGPSLLLGRASSSLKVSICPKDGHNTMKVNGIAEMLCSKASRFRGSFGFFGAFRRRNAATSTVNYSTVPRLDILTVCPPRTEDFRTRTRTPVAFQGRHKSLF